METSSISLKCTFNLPSVYFLVYHLTSKKDHFSLSTTVSLSILLCHPLKSLTMLIVREIKTLSCSLLFRLRVLPLIVHCHLGCFFPCHTVALCHFANPSHTTMRTYRNRISFGKSICLFTRGIKHVS